jgi:hypothetical protein
MKAVKGKAAHLDMQRKTVLSYVELLAYLLVRCVRAWTRRCV